MLQIAHIRENKEAVIKALAKRNIDATTLIETAIDLDEKRRSTQVELDNVLAESNKISKDIGALMKSGEKAKAEILKTKTSSLKEKEAELKAKLNEYIDKLQEELYKIPNTPAEIVPSGKDAEDNLNVYQEGEIPTLFDGALPHWELSKKYDLIDFELGVKITGAGFPVYKGKGARLQRALINFFLDAARDAGYLEVQPPYLVNSDSGFGTGQLPDKEGQMYHVGLDDLYLIPTSEVPVTNMYRDVILEEKDLPVRNTAYSACFRREAGSYGKNVRR